MAAQSYERRFDSTLAPEMIEEAKRLPPSMVAVGATFVSLFIVLALGTILAVVEDDTPPAPPLDEFPTTAEAVVVDSISTCTDTACDGYGVVLMAGDVNAATLSERLVGHWRAQGWHSVPCRDGSRVCFADDDLRISVRDWNQVDPLFAPTLVETVENRQLSGDRLLYVHYFRCGAIVSCE